MRGTLVDKCGRCGAWMSKASQEQHGALQAVLEDVALQQDWPPGSGQLQGPRAWWELFIATFDRAQGEEAELMPALDGKGFDGNGFDFIRGQRKRSRVNRLEISEIIEFVSAWAIERGVKLREFEEKKRAAA